MIVDEYKHYIRLNEAGIIVHGFSSAFEQPQAGDICINEDAGRHFQTPLTNERGQFKYKWTGQMEERSQAELDAEWNARPPAPPSEEEKLRAEIAYLKERDSRMQDDITSIIEGLTGGV